MNFEYEEDSIPLGHTKKSFTNRQTNFDDNFTTQYFLSIKNLRYLTRMLCSRQNNEQKEFDIFKMTIPTIAYNWAAKNNLSNDAYPLGVNNSDTLLDFYNKKFLDDHKDLFNEIKQQKSGDLKPDKNPARDFYKVQDMDGNYVWKKAKDILPQEFNSLDSYDAQSSSVTSSSNKYRYNNRIPYVSNLGQKRMVQYDIENVDGLYINDPESASRGNLVRGYDMTSVMNSTYQHPKDKKHIPYENRFTKNQDNLTSNKKYINNKHINNRLPFATQKDFDILDQNPSLYDVQQSELQHSTGIQQPYGVW
jgi:hypothetical protein